MKKTLYIAIAMVFTAVLAGCGGGSDRDEIITTTGPGLVGIDDRTTATAPILTVTYTVPPSATRTTVNISSDPASDGDIESDPVSNAFTVTSNPGIVFLGFDRSNPNIPEFRGFLTFPLDGSTNQPIVPSGAEIVSATLDVVVDQVSFFSFVPTFIELVQYPFRGLSAADFDTVPFATGSFDFQWDDPAASGVVFDVTSLMREAQLQGFFDFQVRFVVDFPGRNSAARSPSDKVERSLRSAPRSMDNVVPDRGSSSARPENVPDPASRKR